MKRTKIAITGANGFLGKHLVCALRRKENIELVLFDKSKNSLFDLSSLESFLKGVNVVIHLAGANRDSDFNLLKINTLGAMGLLDGMLKYSPDAKLIFASSFQAKGKSLYGLSKKYAEGIIEYVSVKPSIKSIVLRISNIYGKGGKPLYNSVVATFVDMLKKDKTLLVNGDGEQKRDYIYVEDVVDAIVKSIDYIPKNYIEYFDICSGVTISINEIIKILERLFSKKIEIQYNNKAVASEEELSGSYLKAKECLKWIPIISIDDGLKKTIEG